MAEAATLSRGGTGRPSLGRLSTYWRRLYESPSTLFGTCVVLFFLFMAIFGPLVSPYGFAEQTAAIRQGPSAAHLFGTDGFGRDVLSRVLVGSRDIFVLSGTGTLIAVFIGLTLGLFSGYYGGLMDEVLMRLMDLLLAIPPLLLAMLLLAMVGPSTLNVVAVVAILYIPMVSRVVRSVVLELKTKEFVEAAKTRGESSLYIMFQEILPNAVPPLIVEAAARFSYSIFLIASLGFLGLGVQPPSPNWGLMVAEARDAYSLAPWTLLFPSGAISLMIVGVYMMSDGLRRILRPGLTGE
ncbi:MAG: ABC transporter permease [Dehalococcoidales bacterium]|nr:ABC transporter permease [Dehalococcoidales bacterium]